MFAGHNVPGHYMLWGIFCHASNSLLLKGSDKMCSDEDTIYCYEPHWCQHTVTLTAYKTDMVASSNRVIHT